MKRLTPERREMQHPTLSRSSYLLVLVPVTLFFLITIRPGHDWGGDFAQYIGHARSLVEGKPYDDIGYVYCPYRPSLGPREYPPGFPFLLAPLYALFGLSFIVFKLEMVFFLVASIAVIVFFSKEYISDRARLAFVLLFALNPWVVSLKDSVISDIPFLLALYLFLVWASKVYASRRFTARAAVLCGILIFVAYMIRGPGLLLIPVLLGYDLYDNKRISLFGLMAVLTAIVLILLSKVFFHSEVSYLEQMQQWSPDVVLVNAQHYLRTFLRLWPEVLGIEASKYVVRVLMSLLAIVGLAVRGRIGIGEVFLAGYVLLILFFPFQQGLRYLLPVIPLYFFYLLIGVEFLARRTRRGTSRYAMIGAFGILACASYLSGLVNVVKDARTIPDGPFSVEAVQMINYVRENAESDATLAFRKPRVLALFTERESTTYPPSAESDLILEYFAGASVDYLIIDTHDETDREYLLPLVHENSSYFREFYRNERFVAYTFTKGSEVDR